MKRRMSRNGGMSKAEKVRIQIIDFVRFTRKYIFIINSRRDLVNQTIMIFQYLPKNAARHLIARGMTVNMPSKAISEGPIALPFFWLDIEKFSVADIFLELERQRKVKLPQHQHASTRGSIG